MDIDKKTAQSELNLQRKLDWIGRHDTRVAFATGVIIAMLGVLVSASTLITTWNCYLYLSFGSTGFLLFASLILIYFSQYPKIASQNASLIFFGTISKLKFEEFKFRAKEMSQEEYLDDLLCQTYINARILNKKFSNLRTALLLLGVAIIPWLVSIYLSKIFLK